MRLKKVTLLLPLAVFAGCTQSSTIRTSTNTAVIQTSAAPICGAAGAARAAQYQAAVETIRAGFDRFVIVDTNSENTVRAHLMPGSYQTIGTINNGSIYASTTYRPGPVIVVGSHNQGLAIRMFKNGQPGSESAISAQQVLGPNWKERVRQGVHTCAN